MTMICSLCNRIGIYWVGNLLNNPSTYCPHCGGTNCQTVEPESDESEN